MKGYMNSKLLSYISKKFTPPSRTQKHKSPHTPLECSDGNRAGKKRKKGKPVSTSMFIKHCSVKPQKNMISCLQIKRLYMMCVYACVSI